MALSKEQKAKIKAIVEAKNKSDLKEFEIFKNGTQQGTVWAKNKKEAEQKVWDTYGERREVYEVEESEYKKGGKVDKDENLKEFEIFKNGTQQGTVWAKTQKEAEQKVWDTYGEHREVYESEESDGGSVNPTHPQIIEWLENNPQFPAEYKSDGNPTDETYDDAIVELRSEYESTYLAYCSKNSKMSFEEWLVSSKFEETYEIVVYETRKDFEKYNGEIVDEGINSKTEAEDLAQKIFEEGKHEVVKVQSNDREFIKIFPDDYEYANGGSVKNINSLSGRKLWVKSFLESRDEEGVRTVVGNAWGESDELDKMPKSKIISEVMKNEVGDIDKVFYGYYSGEGYADGGALTLYGKTIRAATGCPIADIQEIENYMRDITLGENLDSYSKEELEKAAKTAWREIQIKRLNSREFPKQYSSMSSASRAIKNYEAKYGEQKFSINKLDEGVYEVENHSQKNKMEDGGVVSYDSPFFFGWFK